MNVSLTANFSKNVVVIGILFLAIAFAANAAIPNATQDDFSPQSPLGHALRDEGLSHSQAAIFATDLSDSIGARLSGSPELSEAYQWAMSRLNDIGAVNVHLEDAGEFGLGWHQDNVWMRMTVPDTQVFIVQPAPWSVGSKGIARGEAVSADIRSEQDFARYAGKLRGKVVFLGAMRPVPQPTQSLSNRLSENSLMDGTAMASVERFFETRSRHYEEEEQEAAFQIHIAEFLAHEGVRAVVLPSRDGANGGGTGDVETDNYGLSGGRPWKADQRAPFPVLVAAIENFGRVSRLLARGRPVQVEYDVQVSVDHPHQHLYNVVADLPGQDPKLAKQYVLISAHLDSWIGGTGATDNGAGVATCLEALRLLRATKIPLRRTVRIVLFSGEEEGLLGSQAYVASHLGIIPRSTAPDQMLLPSATSRQPIGPFQPGADYDDLSIAYNLDVGSGRIRGLPTGGNPKLAEIFKGWAGTSLSDFHLHVFDEPYWPADQSSFSEVGIPGVLPLQDPLDYFSRAHHTNMDTVERLVPTDLAQNSVIMAILLARSANAEALMPRTRPDGRP